MTRLSVLERFSVLHADDIEAFEAAVGSALTPHRLTPTGGGVSEIHTDVAVATIGALSLIYGQHRGVELGAKMIDLVDYYDVNISLGGYNLIRCGHDEVMVDRHTAGIISPGMQAEMQLSSEYRQLHVRIERFALERHLEGLLGRPVSVPIRFRSDMNLSTPAAHSWIQTVRLLTADLDNPNGLAELAAAPWAALLMTGLLSAQPHNYSELLQDNDSGLRRPAPVRRALDLIESMPEEDLSVERLARESGVSARSLQRHFREHVGVPPREYLQQVRLARVHDELLSASPGSEVTVTDTALRWGFTHVSRFAGAYQQRYGVLPSATLRGTN